jgi:arachidonate 15-lipoxygenase
LVPLAIECEPGAGMFLPTDPGWAAAKQIVQVADANHHELVSHLSRTHLLVELFLVATRLHLAPNHPLSRLLVPHFEGTVFINDRARHDLIERNGAIDRIFAGTIASSRAVTIEALVKLDFAGYDLPTRTQARATGEIREYPWRDDALRV